MYEADHNRPGRLEKASPSRAGASAGRPARAARDENAALFGKELDRLSAAVGSTFKAWRMPVIALTVGGLLIGGVAAAWMPKLYTAQAEILFDPRPAGGETGDAAADFILRQRAFDIVDGEIGIVRSPVVLERVIERAKLDQDPEFRGDYGALGLIGSIRGFLSLFSPGDAVQDRTVVRRLRESLHAERTSANFIVDVGVTTRDAEKSATLANALAGALVEQLKREKAEAATSASMSRRDTGRSTVEEPSLAKAEIELITPARIPDAPSSISPVAIVAQFGFAGLALGIVLSLAALLRSIVFGVARQNAGRAERDAPNAVADKPDDFRKAVDAVRKATGPETVPGMARSGPEQNESENPMHPYPAYYPFIQPQEPAAMQPAPYPVAPQQAVAQPQPQPIAYWPAPPMPQMAYPPAPSWYAWPAPQAPGWPHAPSAYAQPAPAQIPPPQPVAQQPAPIHAVEAPAFTPEDPRELEELRQQVREIRETLEGLITRRSGHLRRVA
ncbi:hypothetical protein [Oricola indica]|jgi:capsular polysaccharide biosynthesis protein|uniref:hypothetical protein n=1 Tax=Oricola indica TaxID=2872591 RepID=UPI001CBC0796|nr:hypothetical protein [Oricola indica]